jgi:long-chain fatty acid transport protein
MYGVGFGYALGILVEPVDNLKLGVVYRSNVNVKMKVQKGLHALNQDITASLKLPFPQSVSVGMAYRFNPRWLVSTQFDWVDNSSFHKALVELSGYDPTTTPMELVTLQMYWRDTFTVHLGVEYRPVTRFALRGGMTFDSQSVPERYMAREIQDSNKLAFDVGASVYLGRWRIETAFEAIAGPVENGFKPRVNPDSYMNAGKFHPQATFSFHLAGGVTF